MPVFALVAFLALAQGGVGPVEISDRLIDISGADHRLTLDCKGRAVAIAGSDHVVTLTGSCASIDVSGNNNQVSVTLKPGGLLAVSGSDHKVRWKSAGDVRRDLSGVGNEVVRQ